MTSRMCAIPINISRQILLSSIFLSHVLAIERASYEGARRSLDDSGVICPKGDANVGRCKTMAAGVVFSAYIGFDAVSTAAQIATDWIATCKKCFHTYRPLSSHFTSRLRALPRICLGIGCCRRKAIHSTDSSLPLPCHSPPRIRLRAYRATDSESVDLSAAFQFKA